MTTLRPDHSVGFTENVAAFITQFLEDPERRPVVGDPKATSTPVALRVTVRRGPDDLFATCSNFADQVTHRVAAAVMADGRVDVRHRVTDVALCAEETWIDADPVIELLPFPPSVEGEALLRLEAAREALHAACMERGTTNGLMAVFDGMSAAIAVLESVEQMGA